MIQRYAQFWSFRKWSGTSLSDVFYAWMVFQEKYFSCYILLKDKIYLSDCLYFMGYWAIYVYWNYLLSSLWRLSFEINLSFLIKLFSYMTKKLEKLMKYLQSFLDGLGISVARNWKSQTWECTFKTFTKEICLPWSCGSWWQIIFRFDQLCKHSFFFQNNRDQILTTKCYVRQVSTLDYL